MLETTLEFEVVDVPEETFAFVVRRVTSDEAAEFIHGALARVTEFAAAFGGVQGPPTGDHHRARRVRSAALSRPAGRSSRLP